MSADAGGDNGGQPFGSRNGTVDGPMFGTAQQRPQRVPNQGGAPGAAAAAGGNNMDGRGAGRGRGGPGGPGGPNRGRGGPAGGGYRGGYQGGGAPAGGEAGAAAAASSGGNKTTNPDIESDVPEEIFAFVQHLDKALNQHELPVIHQLLDGEFYKLTQRFFSTNKFQAPAAAAARRPFPAQQATWPQLKFVRRAISSTTTELVYTFLYYTQQFQFGVAAHARRHSWETFGRLFDLLTSPSNTLDMPNFFLWDLCNEFLYQLQVHHNKRLRSKDAAELPDGVWGIPEVVKRFDQIIAASHVLERLRQITDNRGAETFLAVGHGGQRATQALGLFAIIGRARLDIALGDYRSALAALQPLNLVTFGRMLLHRVPAAHVSLFYSVGFCYLMLRRYTDASRALRVALQVKATNRQYVDAMQSQVCMLLALSATLGCQPFDDLNGLLGDRARVMHEEDLALLGQGDLEKFRDFFSKACPKFISVYDTNSTAYQEFTGQEGKELQLRVFMREVQQQADVLGLRGFLRVYSQLDVAKVQTLATNAGSRDASSEAAAIPNGAAYACLICAKHKAREIVHDGKDSDLLSGSPRSTPLVDFAVDNGSVSITRRKTAEAFPALFMQRLDRLAERAPAMARAQEQMARMSLQMAAAREQAAAQAAAQASGSPAVAVAAK